MSKVRKSKLLSDLLKVKTLASDWMETESSSSHLFSIILSTKPHLLKCQFPQGNFRSLWSFVFAVPKMQFKERIYTGSESDGQIVTMIHRSGDVQYRSSVRCYTRQGSAQVMMDFEERPNTDISIITFLPGKLELKVFSWNLKKLNFYSEIGIREIQVPWYQQAYGMVLCALNEESEINF